MRGGLALSALLLAGCAGAASAPDPAPSPAVPGRVYALGLGDSPYGLRADALPFAYRAIAESADMAIFQWDDGVPWTEALTGAPYPRALELEIERRQAGTPPAHLVLVALNPISFVRDGLALYKGAENGNQPLPPEWSGRAFDDPLVVDAFVNHCERMITALQPRYLAYALEPNMLLYFAPERWPAFVRMASAVYSRLKAAHPRLDVFVTLQTDTFRTGGPLQARVRELLPYTDLVAVTAYPFNDEPDPRRLATDYFAAIRGLDSSKPFAVAETCWPAEDVTAPYPFFIPATEDGQLAYTSRLLDEAGSLRALFVGWLYSRDYDVLWDEQLSQQPYSDILRLWKDCGLYRGDGSPRPSLALWREALARPRTSP